MKNSILFQSENSNDDDYEIESPKFLADLFESVAGAIYLDSNLDLETVWKVYYKMLRPYIGLNFGKFFINNFLNFKILASFKQNIPCSPIKALHHLKPQSKIEIKFTEITDETKDNDEKKFECELNIDGEIFTGSGRNKNIAKMIAFKKAVIKHSQTKVTFF